MEASRIARLARPLASLARSAVEGASEPARAAAALLPAAWALAAVGVWWAALLAGLAGYYGAGWAVSLASAAMLVRDSAAGAPEGLLYRDLAGVLAGAAAYALASRPRPGRGLSPYAAAAALVVAGIAVAGVTAAVSMYRALTSSIHLLPLTFQEVLTPLTSTVAGRLVGAAAALGLGSYMAARIASLTSASLASATAARAIAASEARGELELLASGKDYPGRVLSEIFYAVAALLLAPSAKALLDVVASLAGFAGSEYYDTLSPLLYYLFIWIMIRVFTPAEILRGHLDVKTPAPRAAAGLLAVGLVFAAAWALVVPGGEASVEAALGLGEGDAFEVDLERVDRIYLDYVESLISALEFTIRFFWAG